MLMDGVQAKMRGLLPWMGPRRLLFDHLPKCGGTSLKHYLCGCYAGRRQVLLDGVNPYPQMEAFRAMRAGERARVGLVFGHLAGMLRGDVRPDRLKVTVLREPVERVVSHYFYARSTPAHYLYGALREEGMTLERYVVSGMCHEVRNWFTAHFSGFEPERVEAEPEAALAEAVRVLSEEYDGVGVLERLDVFAEWLRVRARLPEAYSGRRLNANPKGSVLNQVTEAELRVIRAHNALDIRLYDWVLSRVEGGGGSGG